MTLQPKKGKAQVASTTEALSENASATKQMEISMSDSTETTADSATAVITPETMPSITWQQARVVTTELLARLYGTDPVRIQQNYLRNTGRFEAGKHFHKLEGEQLGEFKKCSRELTSFQIVGDRARSLVVWTERGAARHAKMLETNEAWAVFERLEDCYFAVQAERQSSAIGASMPVIGYVRINAAQAQTLKEHVQRVVEAGVQTFGETWNRLHKKFRVNSYLELSAEKFEEACRYLDGKLPQRGAYHFPLATADVHDRFCANTWLTPERLTDPKNKAPELDLIKALERDGHDVTGAKVRILAMRDAMSQMVEMREALMVVSTLAKRVHDFADVAREKRGKNVLFVGKPDPHSAIDRHVYRDQMGVA